jgi:hypothetical protein
MITQTDASNIAGAREVYELLDLLERHMERQDSTGRALLYQAKERIRLLIVSIDRGGSE